MIMDDEETKIGKEAVSVYFMTISQDLCKEFEKKINIVGI
jgi:hypothetical protein